MDPDLVAKRVGERMQQQRTRARLTQGDVAARIGAGVDQPRISRWEHGAALPTLVQLFRYADVCGAAPETLVGNIQKPAAVQPPLFADLDPPATRLVTNLVSLLHERTRLLRKRRTGVRRG
jgi:transcriptional regulator with XRE-family HTH domain